MSSADAIPPLLPPLRRVVTGHNSTGQGCVCDDTLVPAIDMPFVPGAKGSKFWITESVPTDDNNSLADGATRKLDPTYNFGLINPSGTHCQATELAPGSATPMHRTASMDINVLVEGELVLIMDDGSETQLKTPGDTVIQRGGLHAWKNTGKTWARWISVLIAAEPAVVDGMALQPVML